MRTNLKTSISGAALIVALAFTAACNSGSGPATATKAQTSNDNMAGTTYTEFNTAVPYPFAHAAPSDPLERKNLAARLTQYNSKGSTNYVYVFTYSGQVIGYYVISGKVSSTGSQMTSTQVNVGCGSNSAVCTVEAIGDDGSYGPSEGGGAGVFFFTAGSHTLIETDLPFLVSSAPIAVYANAPQLDAPAKQ